MVAWAVIRPGLISLFSALARSEAPDAPTAPFEGEWQHGARKAISNQHRFALFLQILSVVGLGEDELRREMVLADPGAPPGSVEAEDHVVEAVTGQRRVVFRVEAHAIDEADKASAFHVVERIRTRLRRSRTIEALDAIEMAINAIGAALDTSYKQASRVVPRATLDITLNAVANEDDPIPVGWIERVEWSSQVQDVDGVATSPPNVTNEITPPEPAP